MCVCMLQPAGVDYYENTTFRPTVCLSVCLSVALRDGKFKDHGTTGLDVVHCSFLKLKYCQVQHPVLIFIIIIPVNIIIIVIFVIIGIIVIIIIVIVIGTSNTQAK